MKQIKQQQQQQQQQKQLLTTRWFQTKHCRIYNLHIYTRSRAVFDLSLAILDSAKDKRSDKVIGVMLSLPVEVTNCYMWVK